MGKRDMKNLSKWILVKLNIGDFKEKEEKRNQQKNRNARFGDQDRFTNPKSFKGKIVVNDSPEDINDIDHDFYALRESGRKRRAHNQMKRSDSTDNATSTGSWRKTKMSKRLSARLSNISERLERVSIGTVVVNAMRQKRNTTLNPQHA